MNRKNLLIAPIVAIAITAVAWLLWHRSKTAEPPTVSLEGADPALVVLIGQTRGDVLAQPCSGAAWGKLGMVFAAHGFDQQAVSCYVQAERFDPANPRWPYLHGVPLLSQRPAEGIALMRHALELAETSDDRAAILFRLARVLIENDELDEAERHLYALSTLEPDGPRVHFALGLLAVARDNQDMAQQHLGSLTESPFAGKQACALLANLSHANMQVARTYQQRADKLPLDMAWPDHFEGEMRNLKVDRLSRIAPFYELQRQGRASEALDFLRKFVAESPDDEVTFTFGLELYKAGAFDEAIDALRLAIRLDPRNVKSHLFLGAALCRSGEKRLKEPGGKASALEMFRQAVAAIDHALALQSDVGYSHLTRGQALKHLGRTEESLKELRHAILCQSESTEMHVALGEALAEAGQMDEALVHLENAVRLAGSVDAHPREVLQRWRAKAKSSSLKKQQPE
jgi:tetratricopeptide (TPR) repeat protein